MTKLVYSAKSRDNDWRWRIARNLGAGLLLLLRPARPPTHRVTVCWRRLAIGASAVGVALSLSVFVIDGPAIRGARALPYWISAVFGQVTEFGRAGWFLWPLAVALIMVAALADRGPKRAQLTIIAISIRIQFLFLAIAIPSLFVTTMKRIIGRARPDTSETIDPALFKLLAWRPEFASFPSGHATTAVAAAVAIGTIWPRARTALWIYAVLIIVSRVALTAHYVSDVLAAAVIGATGAIMVRHYFAVRRLGFSIAPDRSLVQYPIPSSRRIKAVARDLLAE